VQLDTPHNLTVKEVLDLLQYEAGVQRPVFIEEYRNWQAYKQEFIFKTEQQEDFEQYINSKGAPQKWIDSQRQKRCSPANTKGLQEPHIQQLQEDSYLQ